ncbi:hypothetical protein ES703_18899 [subsurface metagenome]
MKKPPILTIRKDKHHARVISYQILKNVHLKDFVSCLIAATVAIQGVYISTNTRNAYAVIGVRPDLSLKRKLSSSPSFPPGISVFLDLQSGHSSPVQALIVLVRKIHGSYRAH